MFSNYEIYKVSRNKRHSSHKSSTIHSYRCVQYFHVFKQWYGCQCWDFLTCIQMLMHAVAHTGCMNTTIRTSALKVNSGEKIPCHHWDSNLHHYYTWPFSWRLYKLSYSLPLDVLKCSVDLFLTVNPACCNDGKWDSLTKILSMPDRANHSLFDLVTLVTPANNLGA